MEGTGERGWWRVAGLQREAWREKNLKVSLFHGVSILQNSVINLERTHTSGIGHKHTHTRENINIAFAYVLWKPSRLAGVRGGGEDRKKCTSRWEEMEELPMDDPVRAREL